MNEENKFRNASKMIIEAKEKLTPKGRVELELEQLVERHNKLEKFLEVGREDKSTSAIKYNGIFDKLSRKQQNLLYEQRKAMAEYRNILVLRLHYWGDE